MGINFSSANPLSQSSLQAHFDNNKVINDCNISEPITKTVQDLPDSNSLNLSYFPKYAHLTYHKDIGGSLVFGNMPDYYTKLLSKEFVDEIPSREVKVLGKTKTLPPIPAHWEEKCEMLPCYHIDKISSTGKGSGTNSIKLVVKKSLQDIDTQGRVTLDACCIDGKTSPAGFYYKLGFRFKDDFFNQECEKWLQNGGNKDDAPFLSGTMYLPKENISHCLNYK